MRNLRYTFALLCWVWSAGPAPAQGTVPLPDIAVSDSSTTYLVFPGPVSLVDVGRAGDFRVKIEANAVFVRAGKKRPAQTTLLVRHGSAWWMGRLVYTPHPVMQLYDFRPSGEADPPGAAVVGEKLSRLRQERDGRPSRSVAGNGLVLSLANVRNDQAFTYLCLKVKNKTNIDYLVDFTDFQLVENPARGFLRKKRNQARRPLPASGGETIQRIKGRSTGYLTYAIPLYAATGRAFLEVTLRERNGARVLVLPIKGKLINRAASI